jgi:hypothetical protein
VEVTISTLTGAEISDNLTSIDSESAVLGNGKSIPVAEIRSLRFAENSTRPQGVESVFLACGSQLSGNAVELNDAEEIAIQLAAGNTAAFPIDAVRGVRLLPERKDSLFERQLTGKGDPENDRVFVPQGTELRELTGILEQFTAEEVSLDRKGAPVSLSRNKVYGILFANAVVANTDSLNATIRTRDGSHFRASIQSFTGDVLHILMLDATKLSLPIGNIRSIKIQPPNLLYASDLTPTNSIVQPVLAPSREWQRDRSIAGGPMQVGNRTFEKGIGMAGGTQITFENPGTFVAFTALVGIDAQRAHRGDCEIVVRGDGQELARHRLRGGEEPISLNIDVTKATDIVLSVDPGEDYDLSDHVNWCDAAFLKK